MKPSSSDLLAYLDIALKFRNHEFNIQILRNVIFTGSQAVLLACYAATITERPMCSLAIGAFGIVCSVCWWLYYRASLYWVRFWEYRCKMINDGVVNTLGLEAVDIFKEHPIGSRVKEPLPTIWFGGEPVYPKAVSKIVQSTQVAFFVLWLALAVMAASL
ncbi:MAG: hypothetical protein JW741_20685 [Sedimentisphaerales bacterium]|nr:hypothetical protein [Sedimentisphaerales bacterium]